MLAVLPQIAHGVLEELEFKNSHLCISLVAGLSGETLLSLIAPATRWVRATPTPAVAVRRGPIAMYPPDSAALSLFARIGDPVAVERESEFESLLACSLRDGRVFPAAANLFDVHDGSRRARRFGEAVCCVTVRRARQHGGPASRDHVRSTGREHSTPGGLNEQLARELAQAGLFEAHTRGLERILARLIGMRRAGTGDG